MDVCGIIADIRRAGLGVYEFRKMTLLGFSPSESEVKRLLELGYKVADNNPSLEGVEITNSSPFQLMRTMAKEFGYRHCVPMMTGAPGDRQTIMWTLIGDKPTETLGIIGDITRASEGEYVIPTCTVFGLEKEELNQLKEKGLSVIKDGNPQEEGIEISGVSPFKVMRILCKEFGWCTNGEVLKAPAPGDRTAALWTLTRPL